MSDEEKEVDVESDEDAESPTRNLSQADKRAHHNALERKRRDHIKDSFAHLRDSIPSLQGEKHNSPQASRAQILNKATDYIQFMRRKNHSHQSDIDDLKRQNLILDQQVRSLEKARTTGQFNSEATSALLSSTDSLLGTSGTDLLLDTALKTESLPAMDPLLSVDAVVGHDESQSADGSDDEYGGKIKRRKRDT